MSRSAETKKSDALAMFDAGNTQAAEADDARTKKGRSLQIVECRRKRKDKVRARDGIFPVPAGHRVARERWRIAEVFHSFPAILAATSGTADPGDADTRAQRKFRCCSVDNFADNLVAGSNPLLTNWQFALHDVQVGATDS